MANYAIGDIQGCYDEFIALLEKIKFTPNNDRLWLAGDLVNRGPNSLLVLRYVKSLPENTIIVLGNHDLHLLAVAFGATESNKKDTFSDILEAEDCLDLCHWLRQQHIIYHDSILKYTLSHAGILPYWSLEEAQKYGKELESVLQGDNYKNFFENMYGNTPALWDAQLEKWERLRFIANAFTRLRFCQPNGAMEFNTKSTLGSQAEGLIPWFSVEDRPTKNDNLLFGHWAALKGETNTPHVFALDTGCVWGGSLTAMRLEDKKRFSV